MTGALLESNDEVHEDGEYSEGYQGDRDIDESHRGGLDEGVVHRCFLMTQNKGTVSVQGRDFGQGTEASEQNGAVEGQRVRRNDVDRREGTNKKRIPPLEKNAVVVFGMRRNRVPTTVAWIINAKVLVT